MTHSVMTLVHRKQFFFLFRKMLRRKQTRRLPFVMKCRRRLFDSITFTSHIAQFY